MSQLQRIGAVAVVLVAAALCAAEGNISSQPVTPVVEWHIGMTHIYQQNIHGGLSTGDRHGRYAGSYDLESTLDLGSLAGLSGASLYVLIEGGGPDVGSIDPSSVGSFLGVNADAIEGQWGQLSELWIERSFSQGAMVVRAGKLDLTGGFQHRGNDVSFDGSWYANDETSQFLNGALVNNPTIPFPEWTLGAAVFAGVAENCHLGVAVVARDAGDAGDEFATWGSAGSGFFYIVEGGYSLYSPKDPGCMIGDYHLGLWGEALDDEAGNRHGFYASVSQTLPGIGDDSAGTGLGFFARAGWTEDDGVEMDTFWSIGLQYEGIASADGTDVLGLGWARGAFAPGAATEGLVGSETAVELYYSLPIYEWVTVSPSLQYIANPGGRSGRDVVVAGVRAQMLLN